MHHFESDNDVSLSLELAPEALAPLYQSLGDIALRTGEGRHLLGQMSPDGIIPVEYRASFDPGVAQYIFHRSDESLVVRTATLIHEPAAKTDPYEHDSPVLGHTIIQLVSELSANTSVEIHEIFTITQTDGVASADVCWEYADKDGHHVWKDHDHPGEQTWESDEQLSYLAHQQEAELTRQFTLDDFEAFHMLSESLGDS